MVTVRGCYTGDRAVVSELTACHGPSGLIWVENAGSMLKSIEQTEKLSRYLRQHGEPDLAIIFVRIETSAKLLFAYDERRNSRAWHELHNTLGSEIVLWGQFETSEKRGFGYSNLYPSELILIDVLSKEPTAKRPKSR